MLLETCRYKLVDGKVITKMFGMKDGEWDIDEGWRHDKKEAMAAAPKVTTNSLGSDITDVPVTISRFARKLAEELDIDTSKVTGTGKDGSVSKEDIVNYYNSLES